MSWQAYVDNQICALVSCRLAAIAGLQDGAIWAKFEKDSSVTPVLFHYTGAGDEVANNDATNAKLNITTGSILLVHFQSNAECSDLDVDLSTVALVAALVTQQELKVIADTMKSNPGSFTEAGIHLGGDKYFCLSAENNLIRGRKGSSALCIVATNTCLLVAATTDGFPPGQLNTVVEKLGDYLRSNNY